MNGLHELLLTGLAYRLGWTLLHSLWQGVAVAILFGLALLALPKSRPNLRYLSGCFSLLAISALCATTFMTIEPPVASHSETVDDAGAPGTANWSTRVHEPASAAEARIPGNREPLSTSAQPWPPRLLAAWRERLTPAVAWLATAWVLGVLALSLWRCGGFVATYRLRRMATTGVPSAIRELVGQLVERLRISRPVRVVQSAILTTPAVIGHLRPVILLPVAAITGLSPRELEAILAHELTHVRRYDYLVNIVQTVVETLLFHHPAVWWISRRIRAEREHCCDDVALAVCGDRLIYARALAQVGEFGFVSRSLAAAASGGSLLERIGRIVGPASGSERSSGWLAGPLSILLAGLFVFVSCRRAAEPREAAQEPASIQPVSSQPADPERASAQPPRRVTLPDAVFDGANAVLDLASGDLLPVASGDAGAFAGQARGDVAYEDGLLFCVRGARASAWADGKLAGLEPEDKTEEAWAYTIPKPPCHLYVRTATGEFYDLLVRYKNPRGLTVEYRHVQEPTGPGLTGVVRLPDGSPAAGAQVALCTENGPTLLITNSEFHEMSRGLAVEAGKGGRYSFPPQSARYALVVIHERGWRLLRSEDRPASGEVIIQPWASVEGMARIGTKPAEGAEISLSMQCNKSNDNRRIHMTHNAKADGEGRFSFDHVPPGDGTMGREIILKQGDGSRTCSMSPQYSIHLEPGQRLPVNLGGTGRPVIGRLRAPADAADIDWTWSFAHLWPKPDHGLTDEERSTQDEKRRRMPDGSIRPPIRQMDGFKLEADGSFRADDIPAGIYELEVRVYQPPGDDGREYEKVINSVKAEVIVPEMPGGRSDEPLDIGEVTLGTDKPLSSPKQRTSTTAPPQPTTSDRPFTTQPSDAALREALATLEREKTPRALNKLLALNGAPITGIEQIGHPTDGAGIHDVQRIRSAGAEYIAVVARRYPVGPARANAERSGWGVVFFFKPNGILEGHLGGEPSPDGYNGEDVQLITLGTPDRWFGWVHRFEKHSSFEYRSEVHLIQPGLPKAFRMWHFANSTAWTDKPDTRPGLSHSYYFLLDDGKGVGRDGEPHDMRVGWEPKTSRFQGPCRIIAKDKPAYEVDLESSPLFDPTDFPGFRRSTPENQAELAWGPAVHGVRLGAASVAGSGDPGKSVPIHFTLENKGERTIRFYGGPSSIRSGVFDGWTGGSISVSPVGASEKLIPARNVPYASRGIDLAPGQIHSGELDLSSYFGFPSAGGEYRVSLELKPHPADDPSGDQAFAVSSGEFRLKLADEAKLVVTTAPAPRVEATGRNTRVYDVADLVADTPDKPGEGRLTALAEQIKQSIAPGTWAPEGTTGSVVIWNDRLIVTHTSAVHRRVNEFLSGLHRSESAASRPADARELPSATRPSGGESHREADPASAEPTTADVDQAGPRVAVETHCSTISADFDKSLRAKYPTAEALETDGCSYGLFDQQQVTALLSELAARSEGVIDLPRLVTFDRRKAFMNIMAQGFPERYEPPLGRRVEVTPRVSGDRKSVALTLAFEARALLTETNTHLEDTATARTELTLADRGFALVRIPVQRHKVRLHDAPDPLNAGRKLTQISRDPDAIPSPGAWTYVVVRATILHPLGAGPLPSSVPSDAVERDEPR